MILLKLRQLKSNLRINHFYHELCVFHIESLSLAQLADLVSLIVVFLSLFQTIRQLINKKHLGLSLLCVFSPSEGVEELPAAR